MQQVTGSHLLMGVGQTSGALHVHGLNGLDTLLQYLAEALESSPSLRP